METLSVQSVLDKIDSSVQRAHVCIIRFKCFWWLRRAPSYLTKLSMYQLENLDVTSALSPLLAISCYLGVLYTLQVIAHKNASIAMMLCQMIQYCFVWYLIHTIT